MDVTDSAIKPIGIPLFATRPVLEPLLPEVATRQRAVLESGRYILGPELEAFETEFAAYIGRRHCIGVANGTDALTIGLRALGVGRGDEVIVPAFGFFATAEAVVNAGATPRFADVDPLTGAITATEAEAALTSRVRAIIPVHIFGNPAPMPELMDFARAEGIRVLEDAAQAAGAQVGAQMAGASGDSAAFSFYPGKNLGAFGDGGAIVTDDDEVAVIARRLRNHGTTERWVHSDVGLNSRLDDVQAAGLRVLLPHLDGWTSARRRAAEAYRDNGLGDLVDLPVQTAGTQSAFHLYVVRTSERELLSAGLADAGIETRAYYTTPLHLQPAMRAHTGDRRLQNSERIAREGLALPMGPALRYEDVAAIVDATRAIR